eukprot:CAMPEP_0176122620 /NCGR_PEP_ID=MMETSP0120_2-20121206/61763_1 /TAXON_ID=160619 /ORGANISM="Kryptoperidinium foliaceum, Strain CCMP 1326" /LENGTH=62 /DNA_ID=CAMNT_0017457259 /DNA_START=14 /DNA_END=202 /DNA_ORIENTATION=-
MPVDRSPSKSDAPGFREAPCCDARRIVYDRSTRFLSGGTGGTLPVFPHRRWLGRAVMPGPLS